MDNSGMSALTEKGALDLAIATLQSRVRERDAEIERLRAALGDARDALRNDFEPDNQSRAWHRANAALDEQKISK